MRARRRGAAALLALGAGCVEPDANPQGAAPPPPPVEGLTIDPGAGVVLDAGQGVGVAIEYEADGWWSFTTACDTAITNEACHFDLLGSTDDALGISELEALGSEADDDFFAVDDFAVQADFLTALDFDTLRFRTAPGATVRVSALLYDAAVAGDWSEDPRLLHWVGGGGLHRGAPSNPLDLTPVEPR